MTAAMDSPLERPHSTLHFLASSFIPLSVFLRDKMKIEESRLSELFRLGSIFVNKERVFSETPLKENDYIRIHSFPKRYDVESVDWKSRLIFENEAFVIINKPAGVPVPPTLDNCVENVCYQLSQVLGVPLYVTQRLDVPVSGLLLLAKTHNFQSEFNRLLRQKRVIKHYRALTPLAPPLGLHTHYMEKSLWAPKVLHATPKENRLECQLEILKTEANNGLFDSEILLLTGRTHQIRGQLSFLKTPIEGDTTYGGKTGLFSSRRIALHAYLLAFKDFKFISVPNWPT